MAAATAAVTVIIPGTRLPQHAVSHSSTQPALLSPSEECSGPSLLNNLKSTLLTAPQPKVLSQHEAFTEEARQEDACSVLVRKPPSPAQTGSRLPQNKETASVKLDPHAFRLPNHLEFLLGTQLESPTDRNGTAPCAVSSVPACMLDFFTRVLSAHNLALTEPPGIFVTLRH